MMDIVTVYFSTSGLATTGLSPTVTVVDVLTDTVLVDADDMTEVSNASGWYKYDFTNFDANNDYIITADAGIDTVDDRYPTASIGATNIWDKAIEGSYTAAQIMRVMAAALAGKVSGAGTGTVTFRDINDLVDRIASDVDGIGNRTDVRLLETVPSIGDFVNPDGSVMLNPDGSPTVKP